MLTDLDSFFVHNGFIMFGPYSTLTTLRKNLEFLGNSRLCFRFSNLASFLILTPGAAIYDLMAEENRLIHKSNFWELPDYEFSNPLVLKLAQHFQEVRGCYSNIDIGNNLVISCQNLLSRLKNKMNRNIVSQCGKEIQDFTTVFNQSTDVLQELGYESFKISLDRIEKDGMSANLMSNSDTYFGKEREAAVLELKDSYDNLCAFIESSGFGLGGVVFKQWFRGRESLNSGLKGMQVREDPEAVFQEC